MNSREFSVVEIALRGLALAAVMVSTVPCEARGVTDFTWTPTSPDIGEWVAFQITDVAPASIDQATWTFGGVGCDASTSFVCTPGAIFCDVAPFQYATAGVKTVELTLVISGVQQAPITHDLTVQNVGSCANPTALDWVPTTPDIGQMVLFTIGGYAGDIRAEWDFGQGGCGGAPQHQICEPTFVDCHEMAFRFTSGGSKTVSVTAKDPDSGAYLGSTTRTVEVEYAGACDGSLDEVYVLQSFNAPGAAGSVYHHEMEMVNPGGSEESFQIDWLPRGANNSPAPLSVIFPVPALSSTRILNVVEELFGLDSAIGALRFVPPPLRVQASHLGFRSSGGSSIGWVIPTAYPADGLVEGEVGHILHLAETADLRTNLNCVNMSDATVAVSMALHASDGTYLDTSNTFLQPFSSSQRNQVFVDFSPVEGYAVISHTQEAGLITCVGVVVDTTTSDARMEPLQKTPPVGQISAIPRAVHDSQATTDLVLFAPVGDAAARIALLPSGQDNTGHLFMDVLLTDQEEYRLPSVLSSFAYTGTAALRVHATTGVVEVSAAETRMPAGIGMLRQSDVRPMAEQILASRQAIIIHLTEDADHRTDIGVMNTSGVTMDVLVDLLDSGNSLLGTHTLQLLPFSHLQIDGVFASMGHPVVADGRARVRTTTPGGSFFTYGLVNELNTGDSWELPGELLPAGLFADGFESGDLSAWSN